MREFSPDLAVAIAILIRVLPVQTIGMDYQRLNEEELECLGLRDLLAIDRTALANERTFLAYARTAIMLAATAVTLLKLFPLNQLAKVAGISLLPIAFVIFLTGLRRYWQLSIALRRTRSRR